MDTTDPLCVVVSHLIKDRGNDYRSHETTGKPLSCISLEDLRTWIDTHPKSQYTVYSSNELPADLVVYDFSGTVMIRVGIEFYDDVLDMHQHPDLVLYLDYTTFFEVLTSYA